MKGGAKMLGMEVEWGTPATFHKTQATFPLFFPFRLCSLLARWIPMPSTVKEATPRQDTSRARNEARPNQSERCWIIRVSPANFPRKHSTTRSVDRTVLCFPRPPQHLTSRPHSPSRDLICQHHLKMPRSPSSPSIQTPVQPQTLRPMVPELPLVPLPPLSCAQSAFDAGAVFSPMDAFSFNLNSALHSDAPLLDLDTLHALLNSDSPLMQMQMSMQLPVGFEFEHTPGSTSSPLFDALTNSPALLAGQVKPEPLMYDTFAFPQQQFSALPLPLAPQLPSNLPPVQGPHRHYSSLPHSPATKYTVSPLLVSTNLVRSNSLSSGGLISTPPTSPPNQVSILPKTPGVGYAKPARFKPTQAELSLLLGVFAKNPFPSTSLRKKLAEKLNLEPRQIQFWFQNRRALVKATGVVLQKPKKDERAQESCSLSPPPSRM
ncbi:hypothetical protein BC830DRAFT_541158 [Chytriomyces sp. MP71]|nr:hypothetical protein BC830DRAFT_541158 [Chytriomyces sp. MP71]